jgi:hypothetical protein
MMQTDLRLKIKTPDIKPLTPLKGIIKQRYE